MAHVNAGPCPTCMAPIPAHRAVGEPELRPKAGDLMACIYCAHLARFTATGPQGGMVLVALTAYETLRELLLRPDVRTALAVIRRNRDRARERQW